MELTDAQNIEFVNDPRRIAAENELHESLARINDALKFDGSAGYYLSVLPPLLKRLEAANESLITVEATVEAEILRKERYHG